jgi:DNA repair exonuclease SbcCD ATPase subunit
MIKAKINYDNYQEILKNLKENNYDYEKELKVYYKFINSLIENDLLTKSQDNYTTLEKLIKIRDESKIIIEFLNIFRNYCGEISVIETHFFDLIKSYTNNIHLILLDIMPDIQEKEYNKKLDVFKNVI